MRFQRLFAAAAVASLLGAATAADAATFTPALTFSGPGQNLSNPPFSLGYEFTTNTALRVVALGIFQGNGSLADDHNVDLWDSSGNLLASTDILAPGGSVSVGSFDYNSISEVTLAANSTFFIGADYNTGADPVLFPGFGGTFSTIPNINYLQSTFGSPGNFDNTGTGTNGYFGPNLGVAVPEPSAWALTLAGIAAMGAGLRSMRRRQVAATAAA